MGWCDETGKNTYLNTRLERQKCIARVAHFENASKSVLGKVANLENFQIRGHSAEVELADENVVNNDGRFRRLVEGRG